MLELAGAPLAARRQARQHDTFYGGLV